MVLAINFILILNKNNSTKIILNKIKKVHIIFKNYWLQIGQKLLVSYQFVIQSI